MSIGKLSFSEIISVGMERRNVFFAAKWLFVLCLIAGAFEIIEGTLIAYGLTLPSYIAKWAENIISFGGSIAISLGIFALIKASATKAKKVDVLATIKQTFWKSIGASLLILVGAVLAIAVVLLFFFLLSRIPYVGAILITLASFPAAIAGVLLVLFLIISSSLLWALLVDKPKLSVTESLKTLWALTLKAPEKLFFNCFLTFIPTVLVLLAVVLLAVVAMFLFVAPGAVVASPLIQVISQAGLVNLFYFYGVSALYYCLVALLFYLGIFAIISLALGFVLSVSSAAYYSVYLDAVKK